FERIRRDTFQSLFVSLRPSSIGPTEKRTSCVDDIFSSPYRVASAPYSSTASRGSIPVPRLFDMRRPSGALIVAWMLTVWKGMSSISSRPAMIMRASHKKMIPRSVELTSFGYHAWSSGVSSGQPSVAKGQSADENQVSSTSSSWRNSGASHSAQAPGSDSATVVWPSGQYHAGIWWPHHSWREMHQGRIASIQ